jgi:dTMP kinase
MRNKLFYGKGIPYLKTEDFRGKMIVVEGADCSGRSTQIAYLKEWLEATGHAVLDTGFKRSMLVGDVINKAKKGNTLGKTTLSLLYCTDFADQLENKIIPALKSGYIVLADRYIFTLMARDIVRGASKDWLVKLFGFAIVPDIVFYLNIDSETLLHRTFAKYGHLDFWESGMDINISTDILESFKKYHNLLRKEFDKMSKEYNFISLNATENTTKIQLILREKVSEILFKSKK